MNNSNIPLLPCPFCGATQCFLKIEQLYEIKKARNRKSGKLMNPAGTAHQVVCNRCGARGGIVSLETQAKVLTKNHIKQSKELAYDSWNRRGD
ncbi:hypothetical protein CI610_01375 [invertebrate metagenome]|uniref:Restriction alleviation protein, Lar family n=1 Tax=invertebrate metagenome TaxID=1711999 RepID=A0A2H9T8T8_9ZZZZ